LATPAARCLRGLRKHKEADEVKREKPAPAGETAVAGVRLTHPERVVFPDAGITKEGLARYYERIADVILPHLEDRPLSLVRCPEGTSGDCFFVKHPGPWAPKTLRRVAIQEKHKAADYLIVDTRDGLIALAQMGVLEIHTWNARASDLERPDRIVFDFDPGPDVAWTQVVSAATRVRDRLQALDLASVLKTTGGKGLHVVVPLVPKAGWGECHELSRLVCESLEREDPGAFVTDMSKSRRQGRILLDYGRNGRGSTSVAAWSTRAKPHAPVSVPVAWDEAEPLGGGDAFVLPAAQERALGRDPWAEVARKRQSVTAARLNKAHAL
jgi:bifunctional non-homologous end joining protein LigD